MVQIPQARLDSPMSHSFAHVPQANVPRSAFNRVHAHKTTFDGDYLIPIWVDECLPGDTFVMDMSFLCRFASPLETPIMDNVKLDFFWFYVPCRLLWDNWEKFMGAETDPGDSNAYTLPQMPLNTGTGGVALAIEDYFGLPIGVDNLTVCAFWHRAYNFIWNEWFRDQNLQDSVTVETGNGPDTYGDVVLLKRGKRHDYFTGCLPWPQKADSTVTLPLGSLAPILGFGIDASAGAANSKPNIRLTGGTTETFTGWTIEGAGAAVGAGETLAYIKEDTGNTGYPYMHADLANATAATINELREAFQTQVLYERDARGGTRYVEMIASHFGVTCPDFRAQRPELLGTSSHDIVVTPIAQTSQTATTEQGTLTGVGTGAGKDGFSKSFTEHGVLMCLACATADLTYQDGIHRMFRRSDRLDFYHPALAHLGEQAVLNGEIYAVDGTTDTDSDGTVDNDEVFGYQERWAEMRYSKSLITGVFRSDHGSSLDTWHLSEDFSSTPVLNATFIQSNTPFDRVVVTPAQPHFIFDSHFKCKTVRPMPTYSVPGLIDRF